MVKRKFISILLVDDDEAVLHHLAQNLIAKGPQHLVYKATNGKEALRWLKRNKPDVLVTGLIMPQMGGLELVRKFVSKFPHTPVIMMSTATHSESILDAYELGVVKFLQKPVNFIEFYDTLHAALKAAKNYTLHIFPLPLEE